MKVVDYAVIEAGSLKDLTNGVMAAIQQGYDVTGGVVARPNIYPGGSGHLFIQTLVKRVEEPKVWAPGRP